MDLAAAQYGLAPALASALIHALWQDALLAAAAALTLRAMARTGAGARHLVAMGFLAAMLVLPALQFLRFWQEPAGALALPAVTGPRPAAGRLFVQESPPVAAAVVAVWLAGVAVMLARHLAGLTMISAMQRGPHQALPPHWLKRVDELRAALGIARAVAVQLSDEVIQPCTARLLKPVIWLPLSLLTRAPPEQLEALLAHELAHIARKDWLWNGVQCVIEALLFFHPAVWWLGRRIRQEREHACDDLAVAACGDPVALAEALAALERGRAPRLALAAGGGSLLQRVSRLLSGPPSRGRWGALAVLGALAVGGLLLATQMGMAGGRLPDLHVEASTDGPLRPGDYRQITANGLDKLRVYRASLDASGRLTETYSEDGQPRPIDADVRRWVADVGRLGVPPPPPPVPTLAELGAKSHVPALLALVAADPAVTARLGAPAAPAGGPINGVVSTGDGKGHADIRVAFAGPKGRAVVAVRASFRDGAWALDRVTIR